MLFKPQFYPSHNTLLPNVKRFGYKIGLQFNYTPLATNKYNYCVIYKL